MSKFMFMSRHAILLCALFCFAISCSTGSSGTKKDREDDASFTTNDTPSSATSSGFIVVSRNAKLYLEPNENAQFIQHLSQSEQRALIRKKQVIARKRKAKLDAQIRLEKDRARARRDALRKRNKRKRKKRRRRRKKLTVQQREARAEVIRVKKERVRRKKALIQLKHEIKDVDKFPYSNPQQSMIVLKVIARKPGWIKVQTLSQREELQHCWRGALEDLQPAELTFYVREDAPKTIIRRFERFELYLGTQAKFQPGTVLKRLSSDKYLAHVDDTQIELDVPEDVIGKHYNTPQLFESPESDMVFKPHAYTESMIKIDKTQRLHYSPFFDQFISGIGKSKRYNYATVQTPCAELRVMHPEDATEQLGRRRTKHIRGAKKVMQAPYARADVAIYTQKGKKLGRTKGKLALGQFAGKSKGFACHKQMLWTRYTKQDWRSLVLCFKPSDISSSWP